MKLDVDYIIRPLLPTDLLNSFKTGSQELQPLKTFLKNQALDFQNAMVAQTYVCSLLNNGEDIGKIIGYLTCRRRRVQRIAAYIFCWLLLCDFYVVILPV